MADCILRNDAICIADYAADEHPYDKDRTRPETYSEYNQGWNDACDYIRGKLEAEKPADAEPVSYGRWEWKTEDIYLCSACGYDAHVKEVMGSPVWQYCPNCGAILDLEETKW